MKSLNAPSPPLNKGWQLGVGDGKSVGKKRIFFFFFDTFDGEVDYQNEILIATRF